MLTAMDMAEKQTGAQLAVGAIVIVAILAFLAFVIWLLLRNRGRNNSGLGDK